MFNFLGKKKSTKLYAPVSGLPIPLSKVNDKIFASKMLGEGVAFNIDDGKVVAPCDGTITMIFPTKHAFSIRTKSGIGILIHIGIDTVNLKGQGFEKLVNENSKIKKGDTVITIDLDFMRENNVDITTLMIVTNWKDYNITFVDHNHVDAGGDVVILCDNK